MASIMRGRGVAAFAAGTLAGIIASRTLPPLLSHAGGLAQGSAGRNPFDVLVHDHREIADLLDQLQQTSDDAAFERTQKLFRLKRRLAAHALAEEDVIYPMLYEGGRERDDAERLYRDHAEIKVHLYALEDMPKTHAQWHARLSELKTLITEHVQQEETVDFPKLEASLTAESRARLFGRMKREKALLL